MSDLSKWKFAKDYIFDTKFFVFITTIFKSVVLEVRLTNINTYRHKN